MTSRVSRRRMLAGVATVAIAATTPGAADGLDEFLQEQLLVDELAINARIKAAMRKWRLSKGYTQDEVAELLEMSGSVYSKIEELPPEAGDFRDSGGIKNGVPLYLLALFCEKTDIDVATMLFDEARLQRIIGDKQLWLGGYDHPDARLCGATQPNGDDCTLGKD
jgi:hypothetical protein